MVQSVVWLSSSLILDLITSEYNQENYWGLLMQDREREIDISRFKANAWDEWKVNKRKEAKRDKVVVHKVKFQKKRRKKSFTCEPNFYFVISDASRRVKNNIWGFFYLLICKSGKDDLIENLFYWRKPNCSFRCKMSVHLSLSEFSELYLG